MKKTNIILSLVLASTVLLMSGCANPQPIQECVVNSPSGFWSGLWHGFISIFSFIGSLFDKDIAVYDVNNNGGWYDFGFLWGAGVLSPIFKVIDKTINK